MLQNCGIYGILFRNSLGDKAIALCYNEPRMEGDVTESPADSQSDVSVIGKRKRKEEKVKRKQLIAGGLVLAMVIGMTGCDNGKAGDGNTKKNGSRDRRGFKTGKGCAFVRRQYLYIDHSD